MVKEIAKVIRFDEYGLDIKRDTFAKLFASGEDPAKAYNMAFSCNMPTDIATEKAKELCDITYVRTRIRRYIGDKQAIKRMSRDFLVSKLSRVIEVEASDYYTIGSNGRISLKPMDEWTDDMKVAFKGVKFGKDGQELKIYDKLDAIGRASKIMGYENVAPIENNLNDMSSLTDDQLKEIAGNIEDAQIVEEKDGES